ncbi:hypothetical protein [Thiolinea disciformis]|uniref:hypothetical protein n=1 Tax=Thiolinea disciformis TaxID=125614 RepID=UPI0003744CAE|nr:hypothetical protein [Thiolinea disciformis]
MSNPKRISGTQRIEMWSEAEREIQRFAGDHYQWHKHIHKVTLDPIQVLKCTEMDEHAQTVDFSSRRMGKTAVKELYMLKYLATHADQELGVVAPREAQSVVNLNYHLEAIRRSEVLSAYIDVRAGRKQMADTYYRFANKSKAQAYGIMANVDGGDLTAASLEEVDDMPHDRLFSRFLLMMGATRRLGASSNSNNKPQIRITGVLKGADTLIELIESGKYYMIGAYHGDAARREIQRFIDEGFLDASLVDVASYRYPVPIGNLVTGIKLGLLQESLLLQFREQLPPDDFTRQLLCVNTVSKNTIWTQWIQRAVQLGVYARLEQAQPIPGKTYKKRGRVSFGYDHTGHGENLLSSRSFLVVTEDLAGFTVPIFAHRWPLGVDEDQVKRDLIGFWAYFKPDAAIGDAYGIGMLEALCDELFKRGLTTIDRRTVGDGSSVASNWSEWPFVPLRFEGMMKHSMAMSLAASFSGGRMALPSVEGIQQGEAGFEDVEAMQVLYWQLPNIETVSNTKTYASYKMVKKSVGDDGFDALMAAHWALKSGSFDIPTQILLGKTPQDKLLE